MTGAAEVCMLRGGLVLVLQNLQKRTILAKKRGYKTIARRV